MHDFWKTIRRLGEDLQGVTVNDVRRASLAFFGFSSLTVVVGGIVYLSGNSAFGLSLAFSVPIVIVSLLVYFVGTFFVADMLHGFGKRLVQKGKRNFNISVQPIIDYSFQQKGDKVCIRIHSSPKNEKLVLRLDFWRAEPRWLIDSATRDEILNRLSWLHQKMLYINQDIVPGSIIDSPEPIARIGDDYFALLALGYDAPIPLGRYTYQIQQHGKHKNEPFNKVRTFTIEVKEGVFTYEEVY